MRKRLVWPVVSLVIGGLLTLSFGGQAFAHAALTDVNPESGSVLSEAPEQVVFTFNEVLKEPGFASVTRNGEEVTDWTGQLDAERFLVTPPADAPVPAGDYVVAYRVVSADGHPINGSTEFTIEGPEATAAPSPEPSAEPTADAGTDTGAEDEANANEEDEQGGLASLLTAPWLWGGLVVIVAVIGVALLRGRSASKDDDPRA